MGRSGAFARLLVAIWCAMLGSIAQAAGGSDVIDDSAVELPGLCHVESWMTLHPKNRGLLTAAPGCTPAALPILEIGAALQHGWDQGLGLTVAGPSLKLQLRDPMAGGWGIAVSGGAAWDVATGQLVAANVTVPVTIALSRRVRIHANAAWIHAAPSSDEWFAGAQIEADVTRELGVMAEGFTRRTGRSGAQLRLRWTPAPGHVDFDLAAGRYLDGINASALTLGMAVRF